MDVDHVHFESVFVKDFQCFSAALFTDLWETNPANVYILSMIRNRCFVQACISALMHDCMLLSTMLQRMICKIRKAYNQHLDQHFRADIHVYVYVYVHVCAYLCLHACMYVCTYVHMYIHTCLWHCYRRQQNKRSHTTGAVPASTRFARTQNAKIWSKHVVQPAQDPKVRGEFLLTTDEKNFCCRAQSDVFVMQVCAVSGLLGAYRSQVD